MRVIQQIGRHAQLPWAARQLVRLRRDTRGVGAVEFAMIFPLMLLMFFGMLDLSNGFAINRKVSQMAQSLADLTSRYPSVQETQVTSFFNIADAIMTPYDTTQITATISQVYVDPASKTAKVVWSRGDAVLPKGTVVSVPVDLIQKDSTGAYAANQYFILGDVSYNYKPTIGWVVPKAGMTLRQSTYMRPRQTTCVMIPTTCTPTSG